MPVLGNCQNTHRMDGLVPSAEAFHLTTNISTAPIAARKWTEVTTVRLIDADLLEDQFGISDEDLLALDEIRHAPTVDAVIVPRCKDCKHLCVWNRKDIYAFCPKTNIVFLPFDKDTRTFFCSLGERKDGGDG